MSDMSRMSEGTISETGEVLPTTITRKEFLEVIDKLSQDIDKLKQEHKHRFKDIAELKQENEEMKQEGSREGTTQKLFYFF